MRRINASKPKVNTVIALSLIPLSGFAMDVFIPSLPNMASLLHCTPGAVQLILSIFLISYGFSQFIVGGLVDSFGRYRPALASMLVFSIASFVIAFTDSLSLIYWMRALQGFTVAVILVSKRAYFVDVYKGDSLKKYTSLFSVIWAIAPIVAPFLGGLFQSKWGWNSNFIFLGLFGLVFFMIEIFVGGESIEERQPFRLRPIISSYRDMLKTKDFSLGIIILGLAYAMILLYGMASPFLIENRLHFSPTMTGYCALISGVAVLTGGTISRILIQKPFFTKLVIASATQITAVVVITLLTSFHQNLFTLLLYVFTLHSLSGFMFNSILSYCLTRFPHYAGKASGLVGGGFSMITSLLSSFLVNSIKITNQVALGVGYGILAVLILVLLFNTGWGRKKEGKRSFNFQRRFVTEAV
jgi:MFS family permease